jgi:hypothetical protein
MINVEPKKNPKGDFKRLLLYNEYLIIVNKTSFRQGWIIRINMECYNHDKKLHLLESLTLVLVGTITCNNNKFQSGKVLFI